MKIEPLVYPVKYEDGNLIILDQTKLPEKEIYLSLKTVDEVFEAIRSLRVRGAPAIGIAAAYGFSLGVKSLLKDGTSDLNEKVIDVKNKIASSRPTAVNLFWALQRMERKYKRLKEAGCSLSEIASELEDEARKIHEEDLEASRNMVRNFLKEVKLKAPYGGALTHCNTGALATGGIGTALACLRYAYEAGYIDKIFVTETRPLNQGSRLTAWELEKYRIPYRVVVDGLSAFLMSKGEIGIVAVGADRVALNGDTANKVGTFSHAVSAKNFGIDFFVVCPESTLDAEVRTGKEIEIEIRDGSEIAFCGEKKLAPDASKCFNPAFDITPANYIKAIITDKRIIHTGE